MRGKCTRTCRTCGEAFVVQKSGAWRYCSPECSGLAPRPCEQCSTTYTPTYRGQKYCTRACLGLTTRLPEPKARPCTCCGKSFTPARKAGGATYCSLPCQRRGCLKYDDSEVQRARGRLSGESQRDRGEGKSYRKFHQRHEHRVIAEQILGRPLAPGEVVHHINEDKRDNRPENLQVLPSQAEHARLHSTKDRRCEVEGCDRKHGSRGMCRMHYQRWLIAQKRAA